MSLRPILLAAAIALLPGLAAAGPASDLVKSFYAPVGFEADPANRDKFVAPARDIFDQADKSATPGEVGCIDFVLAIDAQDFDQGEIDRTLKLDEKISGDSAAVKATFNVFPDDPDSKRSIDWTLRKVGGLWKIADIASKSSDWRLSEFDCN